MSWANPKGGGGGNGDKTSNPEAGLYGGRGRGGTEGSPVTLEATEQDADPATVGQVPAAKIPGPEVGGSSLGIGSVQSAQPNHGESNLHFLVGG